MPSPIYVRNFLQGMYYDVGEMFKRQESTAKIHAFICKRLAQLDTYECSEWYNVYWD